MKKLFAAALLALAAALLCARPRAAAPRAGTLKIVATIFPAYDWTRELLGSAAGHAELTLLLDNGVDLHSYQPSVQDIARLSEADVFIYVGGESDEWVEDALTAARNTGLAAISLLEALGDRAKEEEAVEGMQAEDEDEAEGGYDEHVWLSLRNAQVLCAAITDALCQKDAANAAAYRANLAAYTQRLAALDAEYAAAAAAARTRTLLFGDRFPFRYFADDYGLDCYAAFSGCSAETEASFKTVAFLAEKVRELGLRYVMQIESGDGKLARAIIQSSGNRAARVLTLDSMQSATSRDAKRGATYLGIMRRNLGVLTTALN